MSFSPRQRWSALSSVALHGLVIALLLRAPEPAPERPPEVEVTLELPPPKPRVKLAKPDKTRQKDKKHASEKRRKKEPHTLDARWEREPKPVPAAVVQLPAVVVDAVPVKAPEMGSAEKAVAAAPAPAMTSAAPAATLVPAPLPQALPSKTEEAVVAQAPVEKPDASHTDEGREISTPSLAASQVHQEGSSGLAMVASERVGAPTSNQASSGSAVLSQSAQRASAAAVDPGQHKLAAETLTTLQLADNIASTGVGGAALSGKSQHASAAGETPTDPRALKMAGSGGRTVTVAAPQGGQKNTRSNGGASLSSPAATPSQGLGAGASAGGAEASGSAMVAATQSGLSLVLSDSIPGRAFAWLQERVAGLSNTASAPVSSTESVQMRLATGLAPRQTQTEPHNVPGKTASPALQSTATRAGVDLPGEGKTLRMETLNIAPYNPGRRSNPYLSDRPVSGWGGVGTGDGVDSSQAGQRAVDHAGPAKVNLVAQAGDSSGRTTQAATNEAAMAGVETTAANSICKLPEATSTNLLKAAKGAPRMISTPLMFNPIWVPAGEVVLRVHVLVNGEADQVLIKETSGLKVLDDEAVIQVRSARFQPGERDGRPTDYWADLPIRYNKPHESK